jgi:hypothetical protein
MGDEKDIAIATKVKKPTAAAFDELIEKQQSESRLRRTRELIELDVAVGGLIEKYRAMTEQQPAPGPTPDAQPTTELAEQFRRELVTPDVRDQLRKELSVIAYLLLSAHGRTGSSEVARKLVSDLYLSGQLHKELDDP